MAKTKSKLEVMNPDAAGIDICALCMCTRRKR
ncbi:hypothetical protein Wxf_03051 [Armadillidium vulgare]|nr:hypothetical protein Wxf_03051 [Armadillidium vulgare] [Wolbachia endosymbiont of Armadillidium vulgare]